MKKTLIKLSTVLVTLVSSTSALYADADDDYVTIHGAVNHSFIKSLTGNRADMGDKSAEYLEIDGNEEFQDALNSSAFESTLEEGSKIEKRYIYREVKNVDLDDRDLEDLQGDTLNLGADVEGGNVVQSLNIIDSTIKTDRLINAGLSVVASPSGDASDITNITNIENSSLSGGGSFDENSLDDGFSSFDSFQP